MIGLPNKCHLSEYLIHLDTNQNTNCYGNGELYNVFSCIAYYELPTIL